MEPPPVPTRSGRFRIRVQIIAPEHAHNLSAAPLRQFTIVKNPDFPLPDFTLRHLCNEVVKRYENLYPGERLFSIDKSQDSYGSDLYLDDCVRDVFEDNEVFRVVKGSTMRASVGPNLACYPSVECVWGDVKRHTGHSEFEDSSRPRKQQRLHADPDRPLPSSEREAIESIDQNRRKIESDSTIIPNSQCIEVDKAKSNSANNQPLVETTLLNGVSEAPPRDDVSSSGSEVKQRRERLKLISVSRFKTSAERRRSGSTAVTTPISAVRELSENTPLNKKLKRPSIEPSNYALKVIANKTLPRPDVYDIVETDYEEPITRPKQTISATKSNASFSSQGLNESKWQSLRSLHTPGAQIRATRELTVYPNSNTRERSIFQSLGVRHTNEASDKRQIKRLPLGSTSVLSELDEEGIEREKVASKFQKQPDKGHLAGGKGDRLAAEKPSLKLEGERGEARRKEAWKLEIETKDVTVIGAMVREEAGENAIQDVDRRETGVIEPPTDDGGKPSSWRKGSAKTSLGAKKVTCAPFTPRVRSSVYSLISQPSSQVIPDSPVPARYASPNIERSSPKSAKRISFASTVPPTAQQSVSMSSSGKVGLRPAAPRPSFTDAKTSPKRVSPKPSSDRSSHSKTSRVKLRNTQGTQSGFVVLSSTNNNKEPSSASSGESHNEDDSSIKDRRTPEHVKPKGVFDGATKREQQKTPTVSTSVAAQTEILAGSHCSLRGEPSSGDDCQSEDSKSVTSKVKSSSRSGESESETSEATSESVVQEGFTVDASKPRSLFHPRRSDRIVRGKSLTDDEAYTQAQLDDQILSQVPQSPPPAQSNPSIQDRPRPETRILPPRYSMRGLRRMTEEALRTKDTNIAAARERAVVREQEIKTKSQRVEESSEDEYSEESSSSEDDLEDDVLETPLPSYNSTKAAASADGDSETGSAVPGAGPSDRDRDSTGDKEYEMDLARKELATVIGDFDSSSLVKSESVPTLRAKQSKGLKPMETRKFTGDENRKERTSFTQLARMFQRNKDNNKGLKIASARPLSKLK